MSRSQVLWVAKVAVFAGACVLEYMHRLTPGLVVLAASALGSLGVTNAAAIVSEAKAATDAVGVRTGLEGAPAGGTSGPGGGPSK
jgi:hypothetical protein